MFDLDMNSSKPIYQQIIEQLKENLMKGFLKPGDEIPSVRKLALELKVTPGTVAKAYQELEREHIINTVRGRGTYISEGEVKVDKDKINFLIADMKTDVMNLIYQGYNKEMLIDLVSGIYDGYTSSKNEK